jgi:hypothetical protein
MEGIGICSGREEMAAGGLIAVLATSSVLVDVTLAPAILSAGKQGFVVTASGLVRATARQRILRSPLMRRIRFPSHTRY